MSVWGNSINAAQITLPLRFDRQFSFNNYFCDQSGLVLSSLKAFIDADGENFILLWGGHDSGKTHLLNAAAHYARDNPADLHLYDARLLSEIDPSCLEEFAEDTILAIDNLDAICGSKDWESVFYYLINRCRQGTFRLLVSLGSRPRDLICALDDFQSRLSWGLLLELPVVDEADIENIIRQRARLLGHDLPQEVITYLIRHFPRGLANQLDILHKLDAASLATKKKITIPLVKQVMS